MTRWSTPAALLAASLLSGMAVRAEEPASRVAADKQELAPLQAYVGQWRGVGQVRRGSSRGAWTERADWSWHFEQGRAELVAALADSKFFAKLRLQAGDVPGHFVLLATPGKSVTQPQSDRTLRYEGQRKDDALVLVDAAAQDALPNRISIRLVAGGDRMVVLYERRLGDDVYVGMGEVGATRAGSSFAKRAASGPECVVTGGLGTIAVEYEGKKYFVCCSGCRDLFDEDPAGVLADYRQRKADEKAKLEQ
ncbi:MAG: hypothetical protein WD845_05300 [Pirellulales bacterium]